MRNRCTSIGSRRAKNPTRPNSTSCAADDCAERIVALLNDASDAIGGERVVPGDIAVLVRTNDQIDMLRRRLVARGVPCVGSGRGSVFDSDIARDLELVLFAVLHATDERAVRGALCTRLLGFTLSGVRAWQHDEQAVERELERFSGVARAGAGARRAGADPHADRRQRRPSARGSRMANASSPTCVISANCSAPMKTRAAVLNRPMRDWRRCAATSATTTSTPPRRAGCVSRATPRASSS